MLFLPITVSLIQQLLLQITLDKTGLLQFSSTSLQSVKHATHVVDEYSHGPDEYASSSSKEKQIFISIIQFNILAFYSPN